MSSSICHWDFFSIFLTVTKHLFTSNFTQIRIKLIKYCACWENSSTCYVRRHLLEILITRYNDCHKRKFKRIMKNCCVIVIITTTFSSRLKVPVLPFSLKLVCILNPFRFRHDNVKSHFFPFKKSWERREILHRMLTSLRGEEMSSSFVTFSLCAHLLFFSHRRDIVYCGNDTKLLL